MFVHCCNNFSTGYNFIYLLCKLKKLRTLMASFVLQQVKEVGAVTQTEINTECKILTLYNFGCDNFWISDGCNSALQKIKIVQRTHVF